MEGKKTWLAVLAVMGIVALSCVVLSSRSGPSAALSAFEVEEANFRAFMVKHGKSYTAQEFPRRFQAFRDNMAFARMHNAQNPKLTLGATKFADLTHEEFAAQYLGGYKPRTDRKVAAPVSGDLPAAVNWVNEGAVTPVKNQGNCGSCWSFSTTGSLEGVNYIARGESVSLSEQQLVDCSTVAPYNNSGCDGGIMDAAFAYVIATGGLMSEADYAYTAEDGKCKKQDELTPLYAQISNFVDVQANNETALMYAVAQQPVSIAVDANMLWQLYIGGIIEFLCGNSLDHGVLAVGYDTSSSPYWLVKNSWGADWGENGYIRLKLNTASKDGGICGIASDPSYPVV